MKIHNDIIQGTDEWLELRKGVATCSNFSQILTPKTEKVGAGADKYAKELALQLSYKNLKAGFKSAAMEAGNELEPKARQAYQEKKLSKVNEVGFITSDCGNWGYSPDGLIGEDGLIEIKCPEANAHSDLIIKGCLEMPDTYKCQVQGGLWITGRKWCDFIAYNEEIKNPSKRMIIIRVFRDEEFIEKLKDGIEKVIELRDSYLNRIMESDNESR